MKTKACNKTKKEVVSHLADDIKESKEGISDDKKLIRKVKAKVTKKSKKN